MSAIEHTTGMCSLKKPSMKMCCWGLRPSRIWRPVYG